MPTIRLIMLCLIGFSSARFCAAEDCLTPRQAHAEDTLRLEARLQVTGLICYAPDGKSLYPSYQLFSGNNEPVLEAAEAELQTIYPSDSDRLHSLETEFQNREALAAATSGGKAFCARHAAELQNAVLESPIEVQRDIDHFSRTEPGHIEVCR